MSEEQENDGTWSGLRKTIIGTLGTVVAGGGTWLGVTLFGGGNNEPAEETKTEQAAPAAAPGAAASGATGDRAAASERAGNTAAA